MISEVLRYDQPNEVKWLFHENDLRSDIGMGQWKIGDDNLFSSAATTCIILAAHNSETKKGLLGHFSAISDTESDLYGPLDREVFDEAFSVLSQLGEPELTSIWLGGGTPHIYKERDTVEPDRDYATSKVNEYISRNHTMNGNVKIDWSEAERVIDAELNCALGILAVHNYPE